MDDAVAAARAETAGIRERVTALEDELELAARPDRRAPRPSTSYDLETAQARHRRRPGRDRGGAHRGRGAPPPQRRARVDAGRARRGAGHAGGGDRTAARRGCGGGERSSAGASRADGSPAESDRRRRPRRAPGRGPRRGLVGPLSPRSSCCARRCTSTATGSTPPGARGCRAGAGRDGGGCARDPARASSSSLTRRCASRSRTCSAAARNSSPSPRRPAAHGSANASAPTLPRPSITSSSRSVRAETEKRVRAEEALVAATAQHALTQRSLAFEADREQA